MGDSSDSVSVRYGNYLSWWKDVFQGFMRGEHRSDVGGFPICYSVVVSDVQLIDAIFGFPVVCIHPFLFSG